MFTPDYRHFADVMANRKPARLPLYEHIISPGIMEKITGRAFAPLQRGTQTDRREFFRHFCNFFREMTYDTVSAEVCITEVLPGPGALSGGEGVIQSRKDLESYPWAALHDRYWNVAAPQFDALVASVPDGMKAVGGVGNGVFEIAEFLVGLEYLPLLQVDDPPAYSELFVRIGDLMLAIWTTFLRRYRDAFVACRFGDDLGFKSSLLTNPITVRENIIPQYARIIGAIRAADKPFLWHSCGCIFSIMDDVIALGIGAKHSNEDAIAPYSRWIELYSDRIGLLGGFDLDFLCSKTPDQVCAQITAQGTEYRRHARGYALGSGNSIPDYVPVENYLAMIRGAQAIRARESGEI